MSRFALLTAVTLFSFTAVGCCYRGPICDPCTGMSYGGGWEPCIKLCGPGGLFDTCCTGGCVNPCADPCCGPSMGMAPPMMGGDCCNTPGPSYYPGPSYSSPMHSSQMPSSQMPSSQMPSSHMPGPHLSVPTPVGVPGGPVSYHSPGVSSGLRVSSHPEPAGPVYQQSSNSPWIRAGY
ncbi:hypothetical protein Pla110_24160 [Polystyrenella longa]|uniref:Uncharacterized protein n=1 Tax=Polystyrenella longa TaxID=2528007 RepID=A0A518CNB3_9PLAN|nr:hypothetical protein Pla110_24160 [Polystyrenella longa]